MRIHQLIIDTREQNPLPIPEFLDLLDPACLPTAPRSTRVMIRVVNRKLDVADMVLADEPGTIYASGTPRLAGVVERKAALDEIADNLFNPKRRPSFITLLSRMAAEWAHPVLLVEGGLSTLYRPGRRHPPGLVIDGLQRLSLEYRVPIQLIDGRSLLQRAHVGDWVARFLVNASLRGGFR